MYGSAFVLHTVLLASYNFELAMMLLDYVLFVNILDLWYNPGNLQGPDQRVQQDLARQQLPLWRESKTEAQIMIEEVDGGSISYTFAFLRKDTAHSRKNAQAERHNI